MITDMLLICSHNSVLLPSSVPHYQIFNKCYTTVTTNGAGTAYPSGIPSFMRGFLIGPSCLNLRFPSSISVSIVILFCPFLRANTLSVLWFSVPVYPIGVFKLFVFPLRTEQLFASICPRIRLTLDKQILLYLQLTLFKVLAWLASFMLLMVVTE